MTRTDHLLYWAAIIGAPVIYLANLSLAYAIAHWVCKTGHVSAFHALSALALLLVVAPLALLWMAGRSPAGSEAAGSTERARFLAPIAVGSTLLYALATILQWVAQLTIAPCMT